MVNQMLEFDEKSDKGIFLDYASNARAYKVFNKRTLLVEESPHVIFDESNSKLIQLDDLDFDIAEKKENSQSDGTSKNALDPSLTLQREDPALVDLQDKVEDDPELPKEWRFMKNHPSSNILGSLGDTLKMRLAYRQVLENDLLPLISHVEPKTVDKALADDSWIQVMHEELHQFQQNKVWTLVSRPNDYSVI